MEQTKEINKTLRMVRKHLPPPGTELGMYTFLAPDALWIGTVDAQRPFVVVAEEYMGGENGTFLLIVLSDGPVYGAELDDSMAKKPDYREALDLQEENLIDYCAADFPKFMEIMRLYMTASKKAVAAGAACFEEDDAYFEQAKRILRQQIAAIDPTAIADTESLWSTMAEEFGYGMI